MLQSYTMIETSDTFPKDLLAISELWFYPAFWWWDTTIYFGSSAFTSRIYSY